MPANYAHYRFGKQLLPGMDAETARSIQRFRRLYDMGLHGPDFFFYYNPLIKTAAGELVKLWDGWSATTGRHIKAFCGLNKAAYMAL